MSDHRALLIELRQRFATLVKNDLSLDHFFHHRDHVLRQIDDALAEDAFRWSPELLTDMVSAKARRDGKAIKLSTYAGEIDRKSAVELRDWLDAVLGDKPTPTLEATAEPWPAIILQAAKPGDVVFVESQRDLSVDDMERIKAMIDAAALGVKIVVLPHDLKVARAAPDVKACTCGASGRTPASTPHDRTCPQAEKSES